MQLFQHSQHNYLVLNYSAPKSTTPHPLTTTTTTTIGSVPFKYHHLPIASSPRPQSISPSGLWMLWNVQKGNRSFLCFLLSVWEVEVCLLMEEAECAHMPRPHPLGRYFPHRWSHCYAWKKSHRWICIRPILPLSWTPVGGWGGAWGRGLICE